MNNDFAEIALYPVKILILTNNQKTEIINLLNQYDKIDENEINKIFILELTIDQLKSKIDNLSEQDKLQCFDIAKIIIEKTEMSIATLKRLAELGKLLNIKNTGFDFDIYEDNEINNYEFTKTLKNFSAIAAAIGFIPFVPVSDYVILSTIQIGMAAKIANIYNFKLDAKEFLKFIFGTLGAGFLFKMFSKIICSFIPVLGWVINAAVAYAGTYALGILTKKYIEAGGELSPENIKNLWETSFEEGKKEFYNLKDFILKKKDQLLNELEKIKKSIKKSKEENSNNDEDEPEQKKENEKPKSSRSKKNKL